MAKTPEGKVKDIIRNYLKSKQIWFTMPVSAGYGTHGVPDFLICLSGRFVAIECKADYPAKFTDLQLKQLDEIERNGGLAIKVVGIEEAHKVVKRLDALEKEYAQWVD